MALQIERIPTLRDNYTYLVICDQTNEAAVIDAPEAEPVIARVEQTGAKVMKILSTHYHFDHSAANPELAKRFDAPVIAHVIEGDRVPGFTDGVEDGDVVEVGRERARVIFIPAHTRGHCAYVFDDAKAAFTGDMLFAAGCGRTFEGDAATMYDSLCVKLADLPDDMRIFCGHEYTEDNLRFALTVEPDNRAVKEKLEKVAAVRARAAANWRDAGPEEMTIPSTMAEERATNPFLRSPDAAELGRRRALKDSF